MATRTCEFGARPTWPRSLTRMVNQVGSPWMLDGKMFFPLTGIPMRNRARMMAVLDVWLPDPLAVATVIEKSFTPGG